MKTKMVKIVAVLLIPLLLLTGCSIIDKLADNFIGGKNTGGEAGNTTGSGYLPEGEVEELDVVIVDTLPELMELPSRSIGNAVFRADTGKTATVKYPADGKEQNINVKDDSGIEWTLVMPGNALMQEEEISITPLNSIVLDSYPGSTLHGILLEPDGLDFMVCSNIIVKKSGESLNGIILTADHNGSELVLSPTNTYEGGVRATVLHFSTLFFIPNDDPSIEGIKEEVKEQYNEAVEAAKKLLKKPVTIPAPPSISLECMNDQKIAQAKEYAELVIKEEEDILVRMAALDANYLFSSLNDRNSIGRQLEARKRAKMNKLIKQYGFEPEKFLAVYHAVHKVAETYNQNIDSLEDIIDLIILLPCAENARSYYMDRLTKEHEHKSFGAAMQLDRICVLLGGESILEQIINAMTFKLKIETDYYTPGFPITIKGEGTLKPIGSESNTIYGMYDKTLLAQGTITLRYEYTGEDEGLTIKPEEFTVKAQVRNWSPCESEKIDILVESFGSDDETYIYEQTYGEYTISYPWVNEDSELHFEKERKEVPYEIPGGGVIAVEMFDFSVNLKNGQSKAADETFKREQPSMDKRIEVHLQLEHTPNE